jgi:hypothetical protein
MQPFFRFCVRILVTITLSVFVTACPGEIDRPERFPPRTGSDAATRIPRCSLSIQVERDLLARRCGGDGCHVSGSSSQSGLDLVTPNAATRIAAASANLTGSCRGRGPLVNPSDRTTGLFFDKLTSTPVCGDSMPLGAPTLSAAEIECVRAYMLESQTSRDAGTDATMPLPDVTRTDGGAPG